MFMYILSIFIFVFLSCWLLQRYLGKAYVRYQQAFTQAATSHLGEFFLFLDPAQLWVANVLAGVTIVVLTWLFSGVVWLAMTAGVLALIMPQYTVSRYRRRRLQRFDEQLPDLLLALAGAMRSGSGMQAALRHIVAQSPAPLSQEFGLMLREQRMGVAADQALATLYQRMPTEGTGLVVSALTIAAQSGGGLAETLERIASTLQARLHLLGRIHALTSQGRMQAWVMSALPFVLALVLHYLDPLAMQALWQTPVGWVVIVVVLGLELTGVYFIRRIVNIQV
ncbi:MAG: type II secretion system F family protein [Burkholderiaceae bacterium]|nr:type II secretion system F family protein [Burkholderiaceae bacterium]